MRVTSPAEAFIALALTITFSIPEQPSVVSICRSKQVPFLTYCHAVAVFGSTTGFTLSILIVKDSEVFEFPDLSVAFISRITLSQSVLLVTCTVPFHVPL